MALVDAADAFAPETVPADALRHLVWVRARTLAEALTDGRIAFAALDAPDAMNGSAIEIFGP